MNLMQSTVALYVHVCCLVASPRRAYNDDAVPCQATASCLFFSGDAAAIIVSAFPGCPPFGTAVLLKRRKRCTTFPTMTGVSSMRWSGGCRYAVLTRVIRGEARHSGVTVTVTVVLSRKGRDLKEWGHR